jgi:hypothetical protein
LILDLSASSESDAAYLREVVKTYVARVCGKFPFLMEADGLPKLTECLGQVFRVEMANMVQQSIEALSRARRDAGLPFTCIRYSRLNEAGDVGIEDIRLSEPLTHDQWQTCRVRSGRAGFNNL